MICKHCNNEMFKDDVDFNFKGNYDNYWICDNCCIGCVEKIRYGECFEVEWYDNKF